MEFGWNRVSAASRPNGEGLFFFWPPGKEAIVKITGTTDPGRPGGSVAWTDTKRITPFQEDKIPWHNLIYRF